MKALCISVVGFVTILLLLGATGQSTHALPLPFAAHVAREPISAGRILDHEPAEDARTHSPSEAHEQSTSKGSAAARKLSLPHPIEDGNYLEALARFHAAVPRWLPVTAGYHEHTDLRIVDVIGVETKAALDGWRRGRLGRDEEHAPGWQSTIVWSAEQNWTTHEGICPMRLCGLFDVTPRPGPMERRIRILGQGYIPLWQRAVDGVFRSCSGNFGGAEICFDIATGFPAVAMIDDERVVYQDWSQYEGVTYPSHWTLYRGNRLQMEASVTVQAFDGPETLFDPIAGVTPGPNRNGAQLVDDPAVLSRGEVKTSSFGQALVKVSVDKSGRVKSAELLDADDRSLGAKALAAAKETVYMPKEEDGKRVPFDAGFRIEQWSTIDPLRVTATSLKSHGTD